MNKIDAQSQQGDRLRACRQRWKMDLWTLFP